MKRSLAVFVVGVMILFGGPGYAEIVNGVSDDPADMEITAPDNVDAELVAGEGVDAELAIKGFMNFDPPCVFSQSLPLKGYYVNSKTQANFTAGNPGLLNQCSNFYVSGFSPPNFLGFNCNARNQDGTIPALPVRLLFSTLKSYFRCKVGSSNNAGSVATLRAYNSSGVQVAQSSVVLSSTMQYLAVYKPYIIKSVKIYGPCIMVLDDPYFY